MKNGIVILLSVCAVLVVGYFTMSKWSIRHETVIFYDAARDNRPVAVDLAVRRDKEMQAMAGMARLPVAIISNGVGVKFTEYSFVANTFAARGYLAVTIQHDLDTDRRVATVPADRMAVYERDFGNITFAIDELKRHLQPNADYSKVTLVGHSNGADASIFFASSDPDRTALLIVFGNSTLPFPPEHKFSILALMARDWEPGAFPGQVAAEAAGVSVFKIDAENSEMTDKGPDGIKCTIAGAIDDVLDGRPVRIRDSRNTDIFEQFIRFIFDYSRYFIAGAFIALLGVFALLARESSLAAKFFAENRKQLPHLSRYFAAKSGRSPIFASFLPEMSPKSRVRFRKAYWKADCDDPER